jgi:hypothetical protein
MFGLGYCLEYTAEEIWLSAGCITGEQFKLISFPLSKQFSYCSMQEFDLFKEWQEVFYGPNYP